MRWTLRCVAVPRPADYAEMIRGTKRMIADGILRSEVLRLARLVPESHGLAWQRSGRCPGRGHRLLPGLPDATCPPAPRSSRKPASLPPDTVRTWQLPWARSCPLLLDPANPIAVRFQQTSGMVMAKGVEDTAFYRYTRLGTLTEVGAEPTEFACPRRSSITGCARRQDELPLSMTTLSTHDTKRSEDARARISVIAELPEEWAGTLSTLRRLAPIPDGPFENLLWQAIVGAWPASRERLQGYAEKAAREAGNSTNWTEPNEAFEARRHRRRGRSVR